MFCLEKDNQKIGAYIKELIEKNDAPDYHGNHQHQNLRVTGTYGVFHSLTSNL